MRHRQDHGVEAVRRRDRLGQRAIQLRPVTHPRVVTRDLGAVLLELPDQRLRRREAGVADVGAIGDTQHQDALAPQRATDELLEALHRVQRHAGIHLHRLHRDREREVRSLEDLPRGDRAEVGVLGETVSAHAEARLADVAVRGTNADRVDHLEEIHPDLLGEAAPLFDEGDRGRAVAVLEDLGGLGRGGRPEPP
jgi:hypothetical protein